MSRSKKIFIFLFSVVFAVTANAEKQVAIGERGKVSIFDGNNLLGDAKQTLKFTSYDTKVAFSLDGKYLVVGLSPHAGGERAKIKIYENVKNKGWAAKKMLVVGEAKQIKSLFFSSDKKYLIAGSGGWDTFVWDTSNWSQEVITLQKVTTGFAIKKIDFSKGYLAVLLKGKKRDNYDEIAYHFLSKTQDEKDIVRYTVTGGIKSIAFVPKTKEIAILLANKIGLKEVDLLASVFNNNSFDIGHKIIETYNNFVGKYPLTTPAFQSFAFSPDGKWMALGFHHQKEGAFEYSIEIGSSKGRKQLPLARYFCDGLPNELIFSPDSKYLGAVMEEKKIITIYRKKGILLPEWAPVKSFSKLESPSIAFSPKIKPVKKQEKKKKKEGFKEIIKI